MSNWERFVDAFFNARVMAKYLPDIAYGTLVTIELAALVIVSGLVAGLALALLRSLGVRPVNLLIVFIVDLFRALPREAFGGPSKLELHEVFLDSRQPDLVEEPHGEPLRPHGPS